MDGRRSDSSTHLGAGTRVGKSACSGIIDGNQTRTLYFIPSAANTSAFLVLPCINVPRPWTVAFCNNKVTRL